MQGFQQPRPGGIKKWLGLNSFGGRLFWMIMLGALAGMGGMAFLFSEMLKRQAEDQVLSNIDSKVNAIASVTESAETLAYSLGVSATTLHDRGAQYPDTYRELILQLFERRPEFVVGLGLGQSKNGLITDQDWLFPYYSALTSSAPNTFEPEAIHYEDFADDVGDFYPTSDRYKQYFEPQASLWTAPYQNKKSRLLTYYYPLFSQEGLWLGSTLVDIDSGYLSQLLNGAVFQKAGNFLLLTQSGMVIADPTTPAADLQTYTDVDGLAPIWQQLDIDNPGFLKGENGYWAYAPVPGQDWLLLGFVPYRAIYGRIITIATLTTGLMGLLLATVVLLAIRKLNQRIKPILLQGEQFARADDEYQLAASGPQDELEQLSLSFFNILQQLNVHQETIRRQQQTIEQSNIHTDQVIEKFLAFSSQVDEEASEQQTLIQKVQAQLTEQSDKYQSIDSRLDALFTLAQTLGGYLESLPSEEDSAQLFHTLDQRMLALTGALDHAAQDKKAQLQAVMTQLITDVANIKAYDRQRRSLEKLHHQTNDVTQARQAAMANSQAMVTAAQSITQILAEIESITNTFNQDAKQVSDTLWEDLQRSNSLMTDTSQPVIQIDDLA